jgi:protocatechuate 3,4-dioxygenase alpha subunit
MAASPLKETPSQTAGPFVHIGTVPSAAGLPTRGRERLDVIARAGMAGERIRIDGIIYDGAGAPVTDAMIELWQADSEGAHEPGLWGRAVADFKTGRWSFETIKPDRVPFRDGRLQAPHLSLSIFARGINIHLQTRLYFPDEAAANEEDPILKAVGSPELIATLIAKAETHRKETVYRFAIHLQGEHETVFFDF